ncbi:hypothetical protein F2P56_026808 [Juglans regia]|uniref:Polymerase nucleotidyl transferase domain-containing protein n=2 Tax=Juglans regia TaxID=51240 RepID=A0A833T2T2_JUGRE|nr:uncharacterized protein LOC108985903 isoform X2 [Juglans regia]KAF5451726.1 hypothetical protein F2P56_026808 [Juglans regia]
MGEHEEWAQPPSGLLPNGLLPNEAASVMRVLDSDRWLKAEERTAELIACIQPNPPSEERRKAVADYVQRLIMKCFPCRVFTFGSVPLKTYLPDGDIDLTAFSKNQNLKETWAHQVRDILENEEKNENAEFHVKEVQYIQAEVKIIKCLVENIVVDISFDQLGGLCTLCFLEEVDHLINQNHLFKRSIILIKAWCYYESRILGAHHGLISTYALETLVLYIFHVFNNSFAGPLEVLYRFLEFFSKFDWDNFCVSLWGPVPISSLPDVTAEPPRNDGGDLLLKLFLDACSSVYAVFPGGQENQGQPFLSKHFNVIDPLRVNNNLGRSVSKGNFFRIRSAFTFGAKRLARLLDCPKDDLLFEVNQFFFNTWERHGSGHRPDAPRNDLWHLRLSNSDHLNESESLRSNSSDQRNDFSSRHESQVDGTRSSLGDSFQHGNHFLESATRTSDGNPNSNSRISNQVRREISSNEGAHVGMVQKSSKADNLANDIQGKFVFARTRSSPELTETYCEISSHARCSRAPESGKAQNVSARLDNRSKNQESDILANHSARTEEPSSVRHFSTRHGLDTAADSNKGSNSYHEESGSGATSENFATVLGTHGMHQDEQDLVNMLASSTAHGFNGQVHLPLNMASGHIPLPIPSSVLASMGYAPRNLGGMVPTNIPFIETPWGTNMQYPQGFPSPLAPNFPGMGWSSNPEDLIELGKENFRSVEMNHRESDHDNWHEQDRGSAGGFDLDHESFEMLQSDDKQQSTSASFNIVPSSRVGSSKISTRVQHIDNVQQKITKENRGSLRVDHIDNVDYHDNRGNEVYYDDQIASPRSLSTAPPSSLRSRTSSESSWEGSSAKVSKSAKEKRVRKTATPAVPGTIHVKGKSVSDLSSTQTADDDSSDWSPLSTMGTEIVERSMGPQSAASLNVPSPQMLLGHGSRQRVPDNSGVVPFTFYPTGPPVPFVTMLPVYNLPTEAGTSDGLTNHLNREERLDNGDSGQNFDSSKGLDQPEVLSNFSSMRRATAVDPSQHKADILDSDFASHWQNLQFGRFCQNSQYPAPMIYSSPAVMPPVLLQDRFPLDGTGRPLSANMNVFTQFMSYGHRVVPVAPQSVSNRPATVYQCYMDEIPKHRSGTGTYLPNPVSNQDRQSTSSRRGNYSYDRSDHHGDRERNWNIYSRSRVAGRSHGRSQAEKPNSRSDRLVASESRTDRPWGPHRHDSFPSHHSQNGSVRSNSMQTGPANVTYGMYPVPAMNSSGVSSNGPTIPPLVMLYPYDHSSGYGSHAEQLEFGSLGPLGFSALNEVSQLKGSQCSGGFEVHGDSAQRSSSNVPSSPHIQRGT